MVLSAHHYLQTEEEIASGQHELDSGFRRVAPRQQGGRRVHAPIPRRASMSNLMDSSPGLPPRQTDSNICLSRVDLLVKPAAPLVEGGRLKSACYLWGGRAGPALKCFCMFAQEVRCCHLLPPCCLQPP